MKEISFLLLKNSLAAKMKRGIRTFCNGVTSTSTLNQRRTEEHEASCIATAPSLEAADSDPPGSPLTLEEMILQLDLEEEAVKRAKMLDDYGELRRRMSCVNNSDILRSARNALNQYPRFSLDGRDAMYRSSFRNNFEAGRKSVCCTLGVERRLPSTVAGECVVWCKPGVVPKLMGLDAMPVPIGKRRHNVCNKRSVNHPSIARKQNLRRMARHELERERLLMGLHGCMETAPRRDSVGSCSAGDYCVMKPVAAAGGKSDWRVGRDHRH
ncbi:hypothetical protein QJS04_geneDACA015155 [Acorus gramineus]|uniref:DUF3741 domain-containing protein n=1 Tax=Acorus gramineus TaxID=55184 RepID=A0AAV9BXX5_ACOGR|nr:hypothetical protein QJS04_geneDACA015155 [Acorus gramineus]